ncbi:MAG TPA: PAS domain S-box protein [Flavitalea sp.]|nr:PAS domain S-box protein [Flavitalea sp.]
MEPSRNLTLFLHRSGSIYHITTDMQGKYTYVNELYEKIFFNSLSDYRHEYFESTIIPEDVTLYTDARAECLNTPGKSVTVDLRRYRSDGSYFWIRWEFIAIPENEHITGFEALGTDVTERKRAEREKMEVQEKLSRERYLLRTLIDHLPDSIYVKDTQSRFIITNRAELHLIGAESEEETIGKTVTHYLDRKSATEHMNNDKKLLETGTALINQEEFVVNKQGDTKWLLTTRVPLQEDDNTIIGLVGISRDITDRKNIEESLRLSNERFNIVSKATNDAIWDWDLKSGHVFWNDAIYALFGYPQNEMLTNNIWWEQHIHPEDHDRVVSKINKHIENGIESWQDEYRFISADGTVKNVFDRGYILTGNDNKPYRMIGAMMDITDRKKLQDQLAAQSIARQRQVTEATIMAQEKERAEIGRELHDNINQILTTTKMYLDMAINEDDIREELMLKSYQNISSAIEEIRSLSKSLVPPSLGDIGIKEAIAEMISNLNVSQKIDIRLRTSGFNKVTIPGNIQLMIFRIVQEQVSNIIKHSKATEAEIKLAVAKNELTVTITDNGTGFEPKKRMRGIGLMNITSRAEVHNGKMDISSSPGNGCTLKISIPL